MRRTEKRYLLENVLGIEDDLLRHGFSLNVYTVETLYLDHFPPTWSVQETGKKYRLRSYNGAAAPLYFEVKIRKGDNVRKLRRKVKKATWYNLHVVVKITYTRREYTKGKLRVTIDKDVTANGRTLDLYVVEVKSEGECYGELPFVESDKDFSKSKWALGHWMAKPSSLRAVPDLSAKSSFGEP